MNNGKKQAFTLAEVMIVFVVVGVLSAILIPTLFATSPDKEALRAKKAYNTLARAVETLSNSNPYDTNDGLFDATPFAQNTKEGRSFFCNNIAEILNVTDANCTFEDEADDYVSGAIIGETGCVAGSAFSSGATNNAICIQETGGESGTNKVLHYENLKDRLDAVCSSAAVNKRQFRTHDGVNWAIQLSDFSHNATVTANGITSPAFYNVVCFNVSDDWSENSQTKYAAGIRKDGKIVAGKKLQALLDENARDIMELE